MRFVLFLLAMAAALGAMPARAADTYAFTLNIGPVSWAESYCPDSDPGNPLPCTSNSGTFGVGNVEFAFDLSGPTPVLTCSSAWFCFDIATSLNISGNSFSFGGDRQGGGNGGFSLVFDHDLNGMLPASPIGFLGGNYSFLHGDGRFGLYSYTESATVRAFYAPSVPEPATWAMMLIGFGGIGAGLRRRPALARC